MKNKKNILLICIAALAVIGITATVIYLLPLIKQISGSQHLNAFTSQIQSMGIWGIVCFTFIQIFQVVIFIVPGEIVELAGGVLYGTFWGYIICTAGVILGSIIVYYISKKLGYKFIEKLHSKDGLKKFKFLQNEAKLEACVFILFLIPGTPKDALTYFIPFTNLRLYKFLILSTIARFPSVITSTLTGSSFAEGNIMLCVVVYASVAILGLLGIFLNNKFLSAKQNKM